MSDATILINTNSGPIRGIKRTSILGDDYLSFQSIPYAEPPIGPLRFKDPVPVKAWTEPVDGTVQGPSCWAFDKVFQKTTGDEDCLRLNVFTNDVFTKRDGTVSMKVKTLRPVMAYIHGGGFMWGSSGVEMYGPDYLMQKDIVFVSLNYRVGAFGFLSINNEKLNVPGNAGLKDQILALKWVKENVSHFGGDPNNITVFGESAGGCSVHFLMISDLAKDLFHKAILMSGCALNNWSLVGIKDGYKRLASRLGWEETSGDEKALEILQNADPADIAKLQMCLMTTEDINEHNMFPFGPIIEPYVSEQCLISKTPVEMSRNAWSKNIPLLIGGTSDDGLYLYRQTVDNPKSLDYIQTNPELLLPSELRLSLNSEKCKDLGRKIKEFYFGDKDASLETLPQFIDLVTDKWFWHGLHRTILSRLTSGSDSKTFVYRFNFDSDTFNHYKLRVCGKGVKGSCHADDLSYLFRNIFVESILLDSPEWLTIARMIGIWTKFAELGHPNDSLIKPIIWKPLLTTEEYKCLNISNDLTYTELPEKRRMAFWDSLYQNYNLI